MSTGIISFLLFGELSQTCFLQSFEYSKLVNIPLGFSQGVIAQTILGVRHACVGRNIQTLSPSPLNFCRWAALYLSVSECCLTHSLFEHCKLICAPLRFEQGAIAQSILGVRVRCGTSKHCGFHHLHRGPGFNSLRYFCLLPSYPTSIELLQRLPILGTSHSRSGNRT